MKINRVEILVWQLTGKQFANLIHKELQGKCLKCKMNEFEGLAGFVILIDE